MEKEAHLANLELNSDTGDIDYGDLPTGSMESIWLILFRKSWISRATCMTTQQIRFSITFVKKGAVNGVGVGNESLASQASFGVLLLLFDPSNYLRGGCLGQSGFKSSRIDRK